MARTSASYLTDFTYKCENVFKDFVYVKQNFRIIEEAISK